MQRHLLHLLIAVALCAGCSSSPSPRPAVPGGTATRDLREVVLRTDRDFAAASVRLGTAEAFALYAAADALLLPAAGEPVRGRDSVRRHLAATPGSTLTWVPVEAEVSQAGDLAWSWGTYELRADSGTATTPQRKGKYLSIWRRQLDGSWKWVVDIGNTQP